MFKKSSRQDLPRAATTALIACMFASFATAETCEFELLQLDASNGDDYGYGVAISGDTAVVGARNDDDGGFGSGSAYVYVRTAGGWVLQQKLEPDVPIASANFGWNVAIEGDTLVVGATENGMFGAGAAYVFVRNGTTWTQEGKLTPSQPSALASFASSVDLSGDTIVIGAPHPQSTFPAIGEAYVYVRVGTTWSEQQRVLAEDGAPNEWFGTSVSVSGDRIAVGASKDDPGGPTDAGSAYVFQRTGTTWAQQQKLGGSGASSLDRFGAAVSLDGNNLVVGAWGDDPGGLSAAGTAYSFSWNGSSWLEDQKLIASNAATGLFFGGSLHLDGTQLVVGANIGGAAYVFDRSFGSWFETDILVGTGTAPGDSFGFSVGLDGGSAVVGAHLTGTAGAAFAYELSAGQALFGCPASISLSAGGTQQLSLNAGEGAAGDLYWVLGSAGGTTPGLPLGGVTLPLNYDGYMQLTLNLPNAWIVNSLNVLDGLGRATASLTLPPSSDPMLAGIQLDHAYVLLPAGPTPPTFASNAVPLSLVP